MSKSSVSPCRTQVSLCQTSGHCWRSPGRMGRRGRRLGFRLGGCPRHCHRSRSRPCRRHRPCRACRVPARQLVCAPEGQARHRVRRCRFCRPLSQTWPACLCAVAPRPRDPHAVPRGLERPSVKQPTPSGAGSTGNTCLPSTWPTPASTSRCSASSAPGCSSMRPRSAC